METNHLKMNVLNREYQNFITCSSTFSQTKYTI